MPAPTIKPAKGIVVARKYDCCGHHEVGVQTADGEHIPLIPGMSVEIIEKSQIEGHTNVRPHG